MNHKLSCRIIMGWMIAGLPGPGVEGALLLIERRETATAVENSP